MIKEANSHIHKPEIRDVQVDDQVTVTRWSKRHVTRGSDKRSTNMPTSAHLLKIPFHTTAQF